MFDHKGLGIPEEDGQIEVHHWQANAPPEEGTDQQMGNATRHWHYARALSLTQVKEHA